MYEGKMLMVNYAGIDSLFILETRTQDTKPRDLK